MTVALLVLLRPAPSRPPPSANPSASKLRLGHVTATAPGPSDGDSAVAREAAAFTLGMGFTAAVTAAPAISAMSSSGLLLPLACIAFGLWSSSNESSLDRGDLAAAEAQDDSIEVVDEALMQGGEVVDNILAQSDLIQARDEAGSAASIQLLHDRVELLLQHRVERLHTQLPLLQGAARVDTDPAAFERGVVVPAALANTSHEPRAEAVRDLPNPAQNHMLPWRPYHRLCPAPSASPS